MKYLLKVYYRTKLMDKITKYLQDILPDWKQRNKKLVACKTFEFETDKPLSDEEKEKILAVKEDWMESAEIEEARQNGEGEGAKVMKSGIYARFGSENKDLVTEATAQEFRDWMAIKGLNISFMSDETLNGFFMGEQEPFRQWEIRTAFIRDAEAKGITVYRNKDEWEAFCKEYEKEAERRYG